MADGKRVDRAYKALPDLHRGILYGDKNMWDFAAEGNAFLSEEREVQMAALEKYNRERRENGSSELQIRPWDFKYLLDEFSH
jgi:hypothetical protein